MGLTKKQRAFVEAYAGNATEAARVAGYAGDDAVLAVAGYRLLRIAEIRAAIDAREIPEGVRRIATRAERQSFWTEMMLDENQEAAVRLRAAELLGKSEADFVDKVNVEFESMADRLELELKDNPQLLERVLRVLSGEK